MDEQMEQVRRAQKAQAALDEMGVGRPNPMERPDRVAARDRRTADERVSDGIDRLTNRKFELEASIGVVLAAWDGMPDRFKADLVMVDAIAGLRELVAR